MGVRSTDTTGTPSNPKGLNERIDGHFLNYSRTGFGAGGGAVKDFSQTISATGGNSTNTYTDGGKQYKAHIFTGSGTFVVNRDAIDCVVIGMRVKRLFDDSEYVVVCVSSH